MLKKTFAASISILLLCGVVFAIQEPVAVEWAKVESAEGRFNAVMPAKPETGTRDVDTAVGKLALHTFGASNNTGQFMLSYADYPNEVTTDTQREAVLDGVRSGVMKGLAADLISETKLTLSGYPGRELRAKKMSDGTELVFSWRMFLVGRRLYQLGVATTSADAQSPDVQKFLTSFRVTN